MFNIGENSSKYVKVWEVEDKGKYTQVKISTSRKGKDNEYINSNWYANLVGKAHNSATKLSKGSTIEIIQGGIESVYSKKHEKTFQNVTIFDFNVMESSQSVKKDEGFVETDNFADDDLPF